jgi:hypothetical protein
MVRGTGVRRAALPLAKVGNGAHDPNSTPLLNSHRRDQHHPKETTMSKGKHGNKEAKKPKKVHVPNPPGLPAGLAPTLASTLRPKKR